MRKSKFKKLNKTAVVVGASSGMGRAFALELASRGYDLIVAARREEMLKTLVNEIETKYEVKAAYKLLDVQDRSALAKFAEDMKSVKNLAFFANNAGIDILGTLDELSVEQIYRGIDINLTYTIVLTKLINDIMNNSGGGIIMNTASEGLYFRHAGPMALYGSAKYGIDNLSRNTNYTNKKKGLPTRIVSLRPGAVRSEMMRPEAQGYAIAWPAKKFARVVLNRVFRGRNKINAGGMARHMMVYGRLMSPPIKAYIMKMSNSVVETNRKYKNS